MHVIFMVGLHSAFRKELKIFLRLDRNPIGNEESTGRTTGDVHTAGRGKGYQLSSRLEQVNSDVAVTSRLDPSVTYDPSCRNTMLEP